MLAAPALGDEAARNVPHRITQQFRRNVVRAARAGLILMVL